MVLLLSAYTAAILPESSRRSEQNHSSAEADRLRKDLGEQKAVANQYKAANRFELPDQPDINLRTIEQLRREIDGNSQRLAALLDLRRSAKTSVESDVLGVDLWGGIAMASKAECRMCKFR